MNWPDEALDDDAPEPPLLEALVAGGLELPLGLVLVCASTGMVMKALATRQAAICFFSMCVSPWGVGPIALPQRTETTAKHAAWFGTAQLVGAHMLTVEALQLGSVRRSLSARICCTLEALQLGSA